MALNQNLTLSKRRLNACHTVINYFYISTNK